jgi:UPF0755 protein
MSSGYYNYSKSKKKKSPFKKILRFLLLVIILGGAIGGWIAYKAMFDPNIWVKDNKSSSLYIATGSNFEDLKTDLYSKGLIIHRNNFEFVAKQKGLPENIKPGHYVVRNDMSNNDLINLLLSGNQTPVKVTFNNIRSIEHLAKRVSKQIEADSASITDLLKDSIYISKLGCTKETLPGIFLPDTYEFYWNTNAEGFIKRMKRESDLYWNAEREKKIVNLGMTRNEVITLASIVEKETSKNDEKPRLAGVYVNRVKKNWFLQADPTLIYAHNDYTIKRVLNRHKNIDSPYNTYKYKGLPPGPICFPSKSSISSVLNYEEHKYMYFCARDDFSGYHVFAKSNVGHSINAAKYRRALNNRKIYK